MERKPLLECEFPDHTMEVEISDSDDSDDEKKKDVYEEGEIKLSPYGLSINVTAHSIADKYLPEEMLESVEEMLESTLKSVIIKYDVDYQIKEAHCLLKDQWDKIDGMLLIRSFCICYARTPSHDIIFWNRRE